jgi:hypothetical protein
MAHINEVRIAALEDEYNKAMKEIGVLRSSLEVYTSAVPEPRSLSISSLTPSSSAVSSPRASSHSRHSSLDSVYGAGSSYLPVSSSHDRATEVISPQFDQETEDELAALGGWGLNQDAFEDADDGIITDQSPEDHTDDEYEAQPSASAPLSPPHSTTGVTPMLSRKPFSPSTVCSSRSEGPRPE